jgi:hypothetical protein
VIVLARGGAFVRGQKKTPLPRGKSVVVCGLFGLTTFQFANLFFETFDMREKTRYIVSVVEQRSCSRLLCNFFKFF